MMGILCFPFSCLERGGLFPPGGFSPRLLGRSCGSGMAARSGIFRRGALDVAGGDLLRASVTRTSRHGYGRGRIALESLLRPRFPRLLSGNPDERFGYPFDPWPAIAGL